MKTTLNATTFAPEIIIHIMENLCYTALDFDKNFEDVQVCASSGSLCTSLRFLVIDAFATDAFDLLFSVSFFGLVLSPLSSPGSFLRCSFSVGHYYR